MSNEIFIEILYHTQRYSRNLLMSLNNRKYVFAVRITQNHILTALATAKTLTQLVNIISLAHKVFNPLHLVIQVASTKHQSNCFFSFFFFFPSCCLKATFLLYLFFQLSVSKYQFYFLLFSSFFCYISYCLCMPLFLLRNLYISL